MKLDAFRMVSGVLKERRTNGHGTKHDAKSGGNNMNGSHRYIASLFLTAAFVIPVAMTAAPTPQRASVQLRVYDSSHKDYHYWDDSENRAWGQYLSENNRKPHEFRKAKKTEKSEYWNWRHSHSDERHDR
jgi:hypothetical protein